MSVDLHIFIAAERLPYALHWGQAIRNAGFDLDLDPAFDPSRDGGFVPCSYRGKQAGFEFSRAILSGELDRYGIGDPSRPLCLSFSTRSSYRDLAASMIAAGVLCSMSNGVLREADGKGLVAADRALAWARECVADIEADIERETDSVEVRRAAPEAPPPKKPKWALIVGTMVAVYLVLSLLNLMGARRAAPPNVDLKIPADLSREVRERPAK